jgi:hypothetical protein
MNRLGKRLRLKLSLLVVIMLTAVLLGPTSVMAQASSTTVKFSDSFPFSFFNSCTGEVVSGVVSVKTTVHMTEDANGGIHAHFHDVFNGRAVGETSGNQYVGPQTDHDSFSVTSGGTLEETFTTDFRFLSRGSADNILTHILFHITMTPDGDVTRAFFNITEACTG